MGLLPGHCSHCGSGFIEETKDYKWNCRKCGRYEVKPPVSVYLPVELIGRQIEIAMQERECITPGCEGLFEVKPGSIRKLCTPCQNKVNSRWQRKHRGKAKELDNEAA